MRHDTPGLLNVRVLDGPICVLHYHAAFDAQTIEQHVRDIEAYVRATPSLAFISMLDDAPAPDASQRQRMARMLSDNERLFRERIHAWCQVTKKPLVRGVITAVTWIQAPPMPTRVFASEADAVSFCRERLAH